MTARRTAARTLLQLQCLHATTAPHIRSSRCTRRSTARRPPARCYHLTATLHQLPPNVPTPRVITSKQDPPYAQLLNLARTRSVCLVEGKNAVDQVIRAGWTMTYLLQTTRDDPAKQPAAAEFSMYPQRTGSASKQQQSGSDNLVGDSAYPVEWFKHVDPQLQVLRVPHWMYLKLASSTSPSLFLAAFKLPAVILNAQRAPYESIQPDIQRTLVLDSIQQPQNVGALIRSAVSFGYEQVICINSSAMPLAPKTMSTSVGATANVKSLIVISSNLLLEWIDRRRASGWQGRIVGLMPSGGKAGLHTQLSNNELDQRPHWLIAGNEARGIDPELLARCTDRWTLPTTGNGDTDVPNANIDSLNVSIAGSIAMYLVHNAAAV